ncbi:MAG: glutamate racemase [Proteobacteria bacterium]|nr:glutamate racemase [Pseudomonadota bacterium]NBY20901.1 glutamate racemase [bacterium]
MTSQKATIAILDSGVGGLSIFKAIRQAVPHVSIIYGCDNKNFPYGPKQPEQVTHCITNLANRIHTIFAPSLMVIACNTASTIALEKLRDELSIPVVGVVPAIKPAALKTKTGTIGLLATPGTVGRPYTEHLIRDHAPHCQVIKVGSTRLVELAEEKLRGKTISADEIRKEIAPLFSEKNSSAVDIIVLGCTHFPLLLPELIHSAPMAVEWIDSSEAIANRVAQLAHETDTSPPRFQAVFTDLNFNAKALIPALASLEISDISELNELAHYK